MGELGGSLPAALREGEVPAGRLLKVYLNRHYSDPFKPAKFVNLVRRGTSKFKEPPLVAELHLNQDGPCQEEDGDGDGDGDGGATAGQREEGRGMQVTT